MKILFVAMPDSVHTARWISQVADQGWELHLFPSTHAAQVHPDLKNVTAHVPIYGRRTAERSVRMRGVPLFNDFLAGGLSFALTAVRRHWERRVDRLARLIQRIKPDIVHSLEFQHAGYLTMAARKRIAGPFPRWIVTNWGSDIYLYSRLADHEPKIREILASCDFYSCECRRDLCLAQKLGLRGRPLEVFPNSGGFDLDAVARLRDPRPTSQRRLIMLKGYQTWAGRALVGLRALERCADMLGEYRLAVYCPSPDVEIAARLFAHSTGVPTEIIPLQSPHAEILRLHGQARISIGLSISDGISTSFLEALVMGSFPIQSRTACADEWIEDGRTGLLTSPEDPEAVEQAIRRALTDDAMVDGARAANLTTAEERLAMHKIKAKTLQLYSTVSSRARS